MRIGVLTGVLALMASEAAAVSGGGFSLSIQNRPDDRSGYVRMEHGTPYSLCFRNDLDLAADAEVSIDGLPMGTWRLAPYRDACVERPADDTGRFTFYRADSADGYAVGSGQVTRSDKGRVSVRFIPEVRRYRPPPVPRYAPEPNAMGDAYSSAPAPSAAAPESSADYGVQSRKMTPPRDRGLGAGVTGLSGESGQRFGTAGPIERDWANAVVLELRLVHDPRLDRPSGPRPLPGRYDRPAPPPIGY